MRTIQMKTRTWTGTWMAAAAGVSMMCVTGSDAAMVHYYNFDEGSGSNVLDQVAVNPRHGVFGAGKDTANDWVASPLIGGGTALQFNGVRGDGNLDNGQDTDPKSASFDVVNFGNDSSFGLASAGTIMWWYRQDPGPSGADINDIAINNELNANWLIVKGGDTDGQGTSYILHNQPSQSLHLRMELVGASGTDRLRTAGNVVPFDGTWVHIAFAWDTSGGGPLIIYLNGVEAASTTGFGGANITPANVYLGGDPVHTGNGRGFIGAVDELKFFDTFLGEAGVQAEMAMVPLPGPPFTQVRVGPTTFLQFDSLAGSNYVLQVSNAVSVVFRDAGTSILGDGGTQRLYDPNGFDAAAQYRILEE